MFPATELKSPSLAHTDATFAHRAESSDAEVVVAAREGASWAKEALYRRHVRMAVGLAHRLMPHDEEVDDLVQDCFISAFSGLNRLRNPEVFGAWLGSIVVRTVRVRIRKRRLLRRLGLRSSAPPDLDAIVSSDAPPDVKVELRAVYALVEQLPADIRIALVLRRVEGLTLPQIAAHMRISLATVKRRLAQAERLLQEKMASPGVS